MLHWKVTQINKAAHRVNIGANPAACHFSVPLLPDSNSMHGTLVGTCLQYVPPSRPTDQLWPWITRPFLVLAVWFFHPCMHLTRLHQWVRSDDLAWPGNRKRPPEVCNQPCDFNQKLIDDRPHYSKLFDMRFKCICPCVHDQATFKGQLPSGFVCPITRERGGLASWFHH